MNVRKTLLLCLLMALGTPVWLVSCKKKSTSTGGNKLALIDVSHQGAVDHYRIAYDAYNNVDSIVLTGGGTDTGTNSYKAFTYIGSSFQITDQSGNTFEVYANTNGQILEALQPDTLFMTYNGTELGELNSKFGSVSLPTFYYWANGNISFYTIQSDTDNVTYNTAKSGQIGDGFRIDAFLSYGRPYILTSDLPVTVTASGVWAEHFFYQFDGQGRISQLLKVANNNGAAVNDSTQYNYQYYAE